jgi:hypothetical protein
MQSTSPHDRTAVADRLVAEAAPGLRVFAVSAAEARMDSKVDQP